MSKYPTLQDNLLTLKVCYREAYHNDPKVRAGFDAIAKIFIEPLIFAVNSGDQKNLEEAKNNLRTLFETIGKTYNPEFPKEFK